MIGFSLNGAAVEVDAPADMPLLWVLRDILKRRGTKFGCGMGLCGACTVHLDGAAVRACQTPVGTVAGRAITTIEGVGAGGLTAVQRAWIRYNVPQCGYCQSGQIMSACALVAANPRPSDEDINGAMSGNLCRCGTYPRIKVALRAVAAGEFK